jgi:uncharacterized protein (DUF4415 family)
MNEKFMRNNEVVFRVDLDNPPPLSPEEQAEIKALAGMKDEDIDDSDIPPLTEEFWKNAKPFRDRHLYRPTKTSTTIRLDSDVLEWFKSQGKGYQTRVNAILRKQMLREKCDRIQGIEVIRHPVLRLTFADHTTGYIDFSDIIKARSPLLDELRDKASFQTIALDPSGQRFSWKLKGEYDRVEYTSAFARTLIEQEKDELGRARKFAAE